MYDALFQKLLGGQLGRQQCTCKNGACGEPRAYLRLAVLLANGRQRATPLVAVQVVEVLYALLKVGGRVA